MFNQKGQRPQQVPTYTDSLWGVELQLSCNAAVDEHSSQHIRRWDCLNVLHRGELNFLTTAKYVEVMLIKANYSHVNFRSFKKQLLYVDRQNLHYIKEILKVYSGQLRLKFKNWFTDLYGYGGVFISNFF